MMAARGKGWGVSVFLVVMMLACFSSGVEGGRCSQTGANVKAENMEACQTCGASCSGDCEYGCAFFYGGYPTLAKCKNKCVRLR